MTNSALNIELVFVILTGINNLMEARDQPQLDSKSARSALIEIKDD